MKIELSIREKLVLYFVLLGMVAVTVVGMYSFMSARSSILERSFDQLTSVREVKKARIEGFFKDRVREIELLGKSPSMHKVVNDYSGGIDDASFDPAIQTFLESGGYYSSLVIMYDSSNVRYALLNDSLVFKNKVEDIGGTFLAKVFNKVQKSRVSHIFDYEFRDNDYTITIASPIVQDNTVQAVILLGIPLSAINQIMLETNSFAGLGESGESYLVGQDFLMRSTSRFDSTSVLNTLVKTVGVEQAFEKKSGTEIIDDYRGISVLSSFSSIHMADFEWVILAEIDFREVMVPVYDIRNDIIVISGFIILLLCIVAFVISRKITTPLLTLRSLALDIAKGMYGKTIDITTTDEVGELSEAFNTMSVQIQEKTKESREREKRLNHFYQATTDGIILHNKGELILVNQAVYKMTKYHPDEIMLKSLRDIIVIKDVERYVEHPNSSFVFETECVTKSGNRFAVEVIENPIEFDGEIISASVIRNITERKESQLKLEEERIKRINSFLDGQEDERKRLSRELHDGIGQSLIGIKMRLDMLKLTPDEKNEETLEMVRGYVNQTVQEVRRVSNNLMPSVLRDIGLKLALQKLCDETQANTGMRISIDLETVTKIGDDRIKTYLYRITQEAIHNAVKHSKASSMDIMLLQDSQKVRLIIEDNGVGFDINALTERGNGLYYMQERVSILQGHIDINSSEGRGTYINVRIPLKNNS